MILDPERAPTALTTVLSTQRTAMLRRLAYLLIPVVVTACSPDVSDYHIVPFPSRISPKTGVFSLDQSTAIVVADPSDPELQELAVYGAELLELRVGFHLATPTEPIAPGTPNTIGLTLSDETGGEESYTLEAANEAVLITAATHAGLFYGLQTLRQLPRHQADGSVPAADGPEWYIPGVEIEDSPRFGYRGMHLDVGRHFFPVDIVKRYIDLIAMYKMNTFHWHLTEDQGWRIEIEKYPRLTQVGAYRKETILEQNFDPYIGDGTPYGGFYNQDEIREVVAHATSRYVTVIPEIEMPGHSLGALAAYPELACTEGPFEVATVWGIHEDIYCPREETFAFLEDVLTEVMELFPGTYIHIGGDEAPKVRWEESPLAQEVIKREGLANEHELQSYFIRRIESFLRDHGRRLIGWDEILEGGLAPEVTVMSWRGMAGGIEAARQGHDVIMTPTSHVYFDYYQGDPENEPLAIGGYTPLQKVYEFEPVPPELSSSEARHILGAQGNVWTEYINTANYLEYMVFPRALALSEVIWSPQKARDWDSFVGRLQPQLEWLDRFSVNYRVPQVNGLEQDRLTLSDTLTISLSTLLPGSLIRYTMDGSDPTVESQVYTGSFTLPVDDGGVTVTARAFLPSGMSGPLSAAHMKRTSLRPADEFTDDQIVPGMEYYYYESEVTSIHDLSDLVPVRQGVTNDIPSPDSARDEQFGTRYDGFIKVPESGIYSFYLTSDDGSGLIIGDETVVDNDGLHGMTEVSGQIALEAGYHPLTLLYFQAGGGKGLRIRVRAPGQEEPIDPKDWLHHIPGR
jgi:hexosaminidase